MVKLGDASEEIKTRKTLNVASKIYFMAPGLSNSQNCCLLVAFFIPILIYF